MRALFFALAMTVTAACATSSVEPAQAQPAQAQQAQAARPTSGTQRYVLDGAHTQAGFTVERFGFNYVLGRFDTIAGEVVLDFANPDRSTVNATIQVASVSSGNATRDEHLRGTRWFDAAQFPTIEYRSTSVRRTGDNTAEVTGNLTMHGVTQPVVLNVRLNRTGTAPSNGASVAGFSATATVSRTAFGIGSAPTTLIGDEVRITIEALGEAPRG